MVTGAVALAEFAHVVAKKYPINIALHTDHCPKDKLDSFVRPLLDDLAASGSTAGEDPLFQSHMWDGSAVPLGENLDDRRGAARPVPPPRKIILEIEIGVVGGEEDGVEAEINDKLYTTPEDGLATVEALGLGEKGRYMAGRSPSATCTASTSRATSSSAPRSSRRSRTRVGAKFGKDKPFDLVFHGGSGSLLEEIREAARLRRRQDERRHRHPVRLHPPGRRPHVHATTTAC